MAEKTIDDLPELQVQNANPNQDVIIAQKADQTTYKLSLNNFNNEVTRNITAVSPSQQLEKPTLVVKQSERKVYDLSVPDDAKIAVMSLYWVGSYPTIKLKYFNNANFSGNGFSYNFSRHRAGRMGGDHIFVPIINKKVYFLYEYRHISHAANAELRLLGYI
jgi:hypothetical protein